MKKSEVDPFWDELYAAVQRRAKEIREEEKATLEGSDPQATSPARDGV